MTPMDRSGTEDAKTILHAQLEVAEAMVGNALNRTSNYELMWGPLGGPTIKFMRMMLEAQRLYIEELKRTLN